MQDTIIKQEKTMSNKKKPIYYNMSFIKKKYNMSTNDVKKVLTRHKIIEKDSRGISPTDEAIGLEIAIDAGSSYGNSHYWKFKKEKILEIFKVKAENYITIETYKDAIKNLRKIDDKYLKDEGIEQWNWKYVIYALMSTLIENKHRFPKKIQKAVDINIDYLNNNKTFNEKDGNYLFF